MADTRARTDTAAVPLPAPVAWAGRHHVYYGWLIAGASGVALFNSAAMSASTFSVFARPMSEEFGWSRTAVSAAVGVASSIAMFAAPLAGWWADRRGGRLLLGVGSLLLGAALLGLGFVGGLVAFYVVYGVGRTLMLGVIELTGPTVVANWFVRRRALATAVAGLINRVGLGVWPVLASALIVAAGWRQAWWVLGGIVCVLALVPIVFIMGRRPEEFGLLPDGGTPPATATAPRPEAAMTARDALRAPVFWLLAISVVAISGSGAALGVHRLLFFVERGMDERLASVLVGTLALGMTFGGLVGAWLMATLGVRSATALLVLASGVLTAGLVLVPANGFAFAYAVVEGLALGGVYTAYPVLYADTFGRVSLGVIRGITEPLGFAANALGVILAGVLYDATGGRYTVAFTAFGALLVIGAAFVWSARPRRAGAT